MVNNAPDRTDKQKKESIENKTIEVVHDADSNNYDPVEAEISDVSENSDWSEQNGLNSFDNLEVPEFEPPFYARYRLLTVAAITITISWLVISLNFLFKDSTMVDISQLLPHELGGVATGIVTPIALMWIVVAFFEKTRIYQIESKALRWHLQQLMDSDGLIDLQFTIEKNKVINKNISLYEVNLKDFEYYLAPIKDMVFPISYYNKPVPYKWNLQFGNRPTPPMDELVGDPEEYLKFLKIYNKFHKDLSNKQSKNYIDIFKLTSVGSDFSQLSKDKLDNKINNTLHKLLKNKLNINDKTIIKSYILGLNNILNIGIKNICIIKKIHTSIIKYKNLEVLKYIYPILAYYKNITVKIDLYFYLVLLEGENYEEVLYKFNEYKEFLLENLKNLKNLKNCTINIKFIQYPKIDNLVNYRYDLVIITPILWGGFWNTYSIVEYNIIFYYLFILNFIKRYLNKNGNLSMGVMGISNKVLLDIIFLLSIYFKDNKIIYDITHLISSRNITLYCKNFNGVNDKLNDIFDKVLQSNTSFGRNLLFKNNKNKYGLKNYNNEIKNNKYVINLIDYNKENILLLMKNISIFNYKITDLYIKKINEYYKLNNLFLIISKKKKLNLIKEINIQKHKVLFSLINIYSKVKNLLNKKKFKDALKLIEEYNLQLNTTQFELENGNTLYHFIGMNLDKVKKNKESLFKIFTSYEEPKEIKNQFKLTYKDYLNYNIKFS